MPKKIKPKTNSSNGKVTASSKNSQSDKKTGGVPLWLCLLIGLLSLAFGLLSPHLLDQYKTVLTKSPSKTKKSAAPNLIVETESNRREERRMSSDYEFPCHDEALAQVLHEKPVPGMHVLCMDQTMKSLHLTFYKGAQRTRDPPPRVELEGLPDWTTFRTTLTDYLELRPSDDLHQEWSIYTPEGELLMQEGDQHAEMQGLVQVGMVMLFQGGQFIWPGVEIGFQRTIDLYKVIPGAGPDVLGSKQRQATLETLSLEPLVFSVEGFLDDNECDFFKEAAAPTMKYSEVTLMDMDKGRPSSDFRTSQSTFLENNGHAMVNDIDYRTAGLVRVPRFHQENVQVLRYGGGEKVRGGVALPTTVIGAIVLQDHLSDISNSSYLFYFCVILYKSTTTVRCPSRLF